MISIWKTIFLMAMLIPIWTNNPLKIRIGLVLVRGVIFLIITVTTRTRFFPLVYYILFLGGILMMFIILSSLAPNAKIKKIKMAPTIIILLGVLTISAFTSTIKTREGIMVKQTLSGRRTSIFLFFLVISYFLGFILTLEKENLPMRTLIC